MSFTGRRIDPYRQRDVVYNPRYRTCTSPGSNAFCSSPAHGEILILLTEVALLVLILNILRRLFTVPMRPSCSNPLSENLFILLGPVVRKVDNAIHWINHYPEDSVVSFVNTYPLDSDLSGG